MRNFTSLRSSTRTSKTKRWLGLLTFCIMFFIGHQSFAQVTAYEFSQNVEGTFTSITTDGDVVLGSEATTSTTNDTAGWSVELPFTFNFDGGDYSSIYVNSNGGATFGGNNTAAILISSTGVYSGAIAAMNRDLWGVFITSGVTTEGSDVITNVGSFHGIEVGKALNSVNGIPTGATVTAFDEVAGTITMSAPATASSSAVVVRYGTGKVFTKTEGSAPNRTFVIEWVGYNDYATTANNSNYMSFQIRLEETTNVISIVYGEHFNISTTSRVNQIGLRGNANSDYKNRKAEGAAWSNTTEGTANNSSVARTDTNYPPTGLTFTWTPPACLRPGNLNTANTDTSSLLSWTSEGSLFDIEWGAAGFTQGNGTLVENLTTTSHLLEGLTPDTAYSFYVRQNCGDDDSNWAGPYTFLTAYCTPTTTGTYYFTSIQTSGALNNISLTKTAKDTGGYGDYTATHSITAYEGQEVSIDMTMNTSTHYFFMWIDFNNDLDFTDEGETVIAFTSSYSISHSSQFVIPNFPMGNYRVRIGSSLSGSINPCGSANGEYQDFTLNIVDIPTCLPPTALTVTGVTFNSANLAWTSDGNLFDIEYGVTGFTPTGTPSVEHSGITGTTYTLTGLDADTNYQYYVRQDCGEGDLSVWAGPLSFYTGPCSVTTSNPTSTSYKIIGFSTTEGYTNITNETANGNTTTAADIYNNYSNMVVTQSPGGAFNYSVTVMPYTELEIWIDLNQDMIFDPVDELLISYDDYASVVHTYTGSFTIPAETPLGDYRMRVRSRYYTSAISPCGSVSYGETEDYTISVVETPSCLPPTALTVLGLTFNSANLAWTSGGNLFDIEYGVSGFTPTGAPSTGLSGITGTTYTLTGLDADTNYQYYVRQDCGDDDLSVWSGPMSFTTLCAPLTPPTANQDFTGFTGIAPATLACWSEAKGTLDNPLTITNSLWQNQIYNTNMDSSHPFGTAAYINLYSNARDEWFISPPIDLGDGSIPYQMEYNVSVTPWTGTADVTAMGDSYVKIVVSTDGGETWSSTDVLHTYDNNDIPTGGGREDALSLAGYTGLVKFAFYAHSQVLTGTPDVRFYIDNWKVVPVPTCPKPTFLGVSNITFESAELTWTSVGTLFDIEYGETGFTPTGTPSTGLAGVSHPYTLTGLTAETSYQYYVRQDCGEGDLSTWAGPFNFYTGYCLATSTGTGNRITGFSTTDGYTNINNLNNGTSAGYNNYSQMIVTQSEGGTFTYTITVPANTVVDIWIDIDQNLIFDPVDEHLATHDALTTTYNGSFTVPMGMPLGDYRLRVRSRSNTAAFNPCGTIANGETEDYTLRIIETPLCLPVTGIGAENISFDSADLFWTSAEGTSFDIEYGEAGFEPTGEPSTGLTEVSNPYTLTGLTPITTYEYYVRQNCGIVGESTENIESIWVGPFSFKTECLPPTITETTTGEVCGLGEVTLSAEAEEGASLAWYASETEGEKLAEGETFTTPTLSETTSYWVAAFIGDEETNQAKQTFTGTSPGSYTLTAGLEFVATESFTIASVVAYSYATTGTTIPSIQLQNASGVMIQEITNVSIPNGGTSGATAVPFTINLNFEVPGPGTYRLMANGTFSGLARDSGNAIFPYNVGDVAQITQGILTASPATTTYYYFYDWTIGGGCFSERVEVVATVTPAPELTLSSYDVTICDGIADSTVTIEVGDDQYDTFNWEPSNNISGDATSGWSFSATESTVYTLTATNSVTGCATIKQVNVFVGQAPEMNLPEELATCQGNILEINSGVSTGVEELINETFSNGTSFPTGWQTVVGAGDAVAVVNANTAGGTANQLRITGNSQTAYVTNRAYYGPINTQGLQELTLEWNNFLNHYSASYNYSAKIQTSSDGVTWNDTDWVYSPVTAIQTASVVNTVISTQDVGSSTFYVSFTLEGQTFGMHNWNIDNVILTGNFQYDVTWSPINNLYTDAAATIPYVEGTNSPIVYFISENTDTFNYTATAVNDLGCESTDMIAVTVNPAIAAPTGTATQTLEDGDILADLVVNGTDLVWYADADLTQVIPNTTVAVDGTTYYVATVSGACQSTSLAITVIIDPCTLLAVPTGAATQSLTLGDTLAELDVTGTNLVWYSDEDLTTEIDDTTIAVNGTTYYVVSTTVECQSDALAITVTVIDPCANVTTPTGAATQTVLVGGTIAGLAVSGNNLVWYADEALTTELPETTVLVNGTTYYVVSETEECQSDALAITVTVIDPCADVTTPTGDAVQTVAEGTTLAELDVDGTSLAWYADANLTQSLPATTVVQSGVTYYVASVTDICQSEPLAITIIIEGIDPCEGVTVVIPTGDEAQTLTEGQSLADLIVDGENLQWYADEDLTEELEETHVAEDNTTYYVTQTIGVCTSEALAVTVDVTLGRTDFETFAFRFYPNPVADVLNLTSNSEISNIDLFNMLGQKVTLVTNANNTQVDMSGLPTGNYIISVTIEGVTKTFKVVKN